MKKGNKVIENFIKLFFKWTEVVDISFLVVGNLVYT
jgi:hypothetical protein